MKSVGAYLTRPLRWTSILLLLANASACNSPFSEVTINASTMNYSVLQNAISGYLASSTPSIDQTIGEQAAAADAFVDSIGVNTHFNYTDTYYGSHYTEISNFLLQSGIRHIRDGIGNMSDDFYSKVNSLYTAGGIKIEGGFGTADFTTSIASAADHLNNLEGIESLNEWDANGGGSWASYIAAYQVNLYQAAKANPKTASLPVIGPSMANTGNFDQLPDLSASMDFGNIHNYFGNHYPGSQGWGDQFYGFGYGSEGYSLRLATFASGSKPLWTTETGYTLSDTNSLSDAVAARYLPRLLFTQFQAGVKRTYIYQFAAEGPTLGSGEGSGGYGMIDLNMAQRLEYFAVKNIISLLSDTGSSAFSPGKLNFTLTGGDASLKHQLFEKRDGSFYLAYWVEAESMNPNSLAVEPVATQSLVLTLPPNVSSMTEYSIDDVGNMTATNVTLAATVALTATDRVQFIRIK